MDNNNNRLDNLFNQAKNEAPKTPFEQTKEQFLKSSAFSTAKTGGKLAQFTNLKTILMIATISTITVGTILFINTFGTDKLTPKENEFTNNPLADSALIIQEHEKIVKEYIETGQLETVDQSKDDLLLDEEGKALKTIETQPLDTINDRAKHKEGKIDMNLGISIDNSFVFPTLNEKEQKAQRKQKVTMIKLSGKDEVFGFVYIPSGTIKLKDKKVSLQSFSMKQTEVTNLQYRTFLFDLLEQGRKEEFLKAKPDQSRWMKDYPNSYNQPMELNYFSHPAYDEYPVVAISREGAEMYCVWLTQEINKERIAKGKTPINDVRLPTSEEWMYAASSGGKEFPYPWGGPYIRNSNGVFLANFRPKKNDYNSDGAFHTAKVNSYNPNDFGLFCMSGNVAEMVDFENGRVGTKGGSWTSVGQELQIIDGEDRFKGLTKASVNVGFRPVINTLKAQITVTPPGTVKVGNNLYFDKGEVTNFAWMEYVYWQKKAYGITSSEYKNALPDTLVWKSKLAYNEAYSIHYHAHPAYRQYPVVGISYEQAIAYCKWRTERVKELYSIEKKENKKNVYPSNFEYRLPTKAEWESAAKTGYSEKTLKKLEGKYKGQARANLKRNKDKTERVAENLNNNGDITAPVLSYWPNKDGIHNLIGNVTEMTSVQGIAKGGAWNTSKDEVSVEKDFSYKTPECWLGFRCILEIKD